MDNIKLIEIEVFKEICGPSSAYFPFGWITRNGSFIQDYPLEPGMRRVDDMIERYRLGVTREYFFGHWIRIEGMLITSECRKITKDQQKGLIEIVNEFPHLYIKGDSRIHFLSRHHKFTHLSTGGIYIEEINESRKS